MSKEAMKLALEALEANLATMKLALEALEANLGNWAAKTKAIPIIKQALEQPEPEPVAYQETAEKCRLETVPAKGTLLHTTPPKREWQGLTKDEVDTWDLPERPTVFEFAKFVEAKLKEKNT